MDIKKLSASSYKRWDFCQMAYTIENLLGYRFPPGKAANVGTISHSILEILAKIKLGIQKNEKEVDTSIGKIRTDKYDLIHIMEKSYNDYIVKVPHLKWESKDYQDVKKYVFNALNHNNGLYSPLNKNIISTEQYIKVPVNENWAILSDQQQLNITGFVDLVTQVNKDTIEITDYKTGALTDFLTGQEITSDSLKDDIQLRFYHLAMSELFGCNNNYLLTMFFLKFSKPITISFSCYDLEETKNKIKKRFLEIYNTKLPKLNKSWKCRKFCDYGKTEWKGNNGLPKTIQFMPGQVSEEGSPMCICDAVNFEMNRRGLDWTIENMKA